ncbi:hypothetical protein Ciccas_011368 [Cichlidogyrus casuarinus]|uniref:C3H1-type domain-containing protein n=1 Tax=Cichlidogyrus casuarinus TaxID=1844966 RepID=A0ABD2PT48_9PLAT
MSLAGQRLQERAWSSTDELENHSSLEEPLIQQVMNLFRDGGDLLLSPPKPRTDSGCPSSEIMSPETNFVSSMKPLGLANRCEQGSGRVTPIKSGNGKRRVVRAPLFCSYPPPQLPHSWRPITASTRVAQLESSLMLLNQELKSMSINCKPSSLEYSVRLDEQIEAAKDIRYKTQMCIHFQRYGECPRLTRCRFAHGPVELRLASSHPKYRTLHCIHYIRSDGRHCPFGDDCFFLHASQMQVLGQYLNF